MVVNRVEDRDRIVSMLHAPLVLKVDISGQPLKWVDLETYAGYHIAGKVAWTLGEPMLTLHGGYNARGDRSLLDVHPIVAIHRGRAALVQRCVPPLTRQMLFRRDQHICAYCVQRCSDGELTMEHIVPVSRGGGTTWLNCVSSCKACNSAKGNRLPDEAGMKLAYVPYTPSHAEGLILRNRRIIADQMEFLRAHVPRRRRERLA
jgi:hypothetical protein